MQISRTPIQTFLTLTLLFCGMNFTAPVMADDLKMTTYYPSPSGNYENLTINTLLTVNNNATIAGTLTAGTCTPNNLPVTTDRTVGNTATITGAFIANGGATVTGGLSANSATITGNFITSGTATIAGDVTANGNATIAGLLTALNGKITGNLTAATASITGVLTAGTFNTVDINASGNVGIAGTLNVTHALTADGGATLTAGNLKISSGSMVVSNGDVGVNGIVASRQVLINAACASDGATLCAIPSTLSETTTVVRIGSDTPGGSFVNNSTSANLRVNGTLSVGNNAAFGAAVRAYKGISLGNNPAACSSDYYGTLRYRSSGQDYYVEVCTPCNNTTDDCAGKGTGDVWISIMHSKSSGGGGGGIGSTSRVD